MCFPWWALPINNKNDDDDVLPYNNNIIQTTKFIILANKFILLAKLIDLFRSNLFVTWLAALLYPQKQGVTL